MEPDIQSYNQLLSGKTPEEIITFFTSRFPGKVAFATSLGAEDQVILSMIASLKAEVKVFTLDTGRLFQETYDLLDLTVKKYKIPIQVQFPDAARVEEMVRSKGINLFYESVENRKLCCHIRKVEPMQRALAGMEVWFTGLRKDQGITRKGLHIVQPDEQYHLIKVCPLVEWHPDQVWGYIREHHIPYNPLHDKGFPSIGCLPCTRAVRPGEDERSGRWWWELPENKECGIHSPLPAAGE
ncbi:MAG TPA: phosphoadenylyl-sulfate reductase [Bacteroidales bacterium]|nr:phosphoadenylyl-sulfate reductase [Bacteroidales bacterium]